MDNVTCAVEGQALLQNASGTDIVYLTRGDSIGLTLVAESGFISLIALLGAFMLIFYRAFQRGQLIERPTHIYILSLFTFDTIMSLGRVTDIKWIHQGNVQTGGFCTAQGVIQQLGETGSALTTLTIAVHIFVVVMRRSRNYQPLKYEYVITCAVVSLTWLFIALFVAIGVSVHTHGFTFYEQPVGFWCWIGNQHKAEQYAGQYAWVWVTIFGSFLAYIPLFLCARGNITIGEKHWWRFKIERGENRMLIQMNDPDDWRRRSIGMLAYPLVFATSTLPVSVVRFKSGFGSHLATATFIVESLYSLSGAFNVLLLVFSRSKLLMSQGGRSGLTPDITGILAESPQGQRMSLRLFPRTAGSPLSSV